MKRIAYLFLVLFPLMATSCLMEEKEVFDQTPAERMDAFLSEYKEILESSENGWLFEYYPEANQSYGGYAYILKFQDGMVTAYFELADEEAVSTFKMTSDDGPVLSFDTYNENLHFFAEPSPDMYQGLQGDYEYKILGKSADDSEIYLRGRKSDNNLTLKKFAGEDPFEYFGKSAEISSAMMAPSYSIKINENSTPCSISDNVLYYELVVKEATETTEAEIETVECAFCYTDTGISFYEPVEIGGVEYTSLKYGEETLVSEDGKVVISLVFPPISETFFKNQWYLHKTGLGEYGAGKFNAVSQSLYAGEKESLLLVNIGTYFAANYGNVWGMHFMTDAGYAGVVAFDAEAVADDKITLKYNPANNQGNGNYYMKNYVGGIVDTFCGEEGKTFTLTPDNPKSPSAVMLTDDSDPTNTITLSGSLTTY